MTGELRTHRVLPVESRASIDVELSELLSEGRLEVFPHVEKKGFVFIQFRRSKAVLTAGAFVGLIPITPWLSLNVQPRLPVENLGRVLDIACRSLDVAGVGSREYRSQALDSNSVLEFLLGNLVSAVEEIELRGFLKEYQVREVVNSQPRGKIDVKETMIRSLVHGQSHTIATRQFEQTSDIAVNRLLKAALYRALESVASFGNKGNGVRKRANSARGAFPSVIGRAERGDLSFVKRLVLQRALPPSKSYYYRAIEIALLVLGGEGISLREIEGSVPLEGFVVNFETLFEDYLRNTLGPLNENGFSVVNGNDAGRKSLFDDKAEPPAQPDIVVTRQGGVSPVICEVKYKEKVDRSDINQAMTYALSYRSNQVVLLHLAKSPDLSGLKHIGKMNGVSLSSYGFDLNAPDLPAAEARFREAIAGLGRP